jgi:hypothetical protein
MRIPIGFIHIEQIKEVNVKTASAEEKEQVEETNEPVTFGGKR